MTLWSSGSPDAWQHALATYEAVIERQGVARLPELDHWYREELPASIGSRERPHVTHAELVRVTDWKMARGIFRARNLALVRSNDETLVIETSAKALARIPHPTEPIAILAELAGVGPATASAVAAAAAPGAAQDDGPLSFFGLPLEADGEGDDQAGLARDQHLRSSARR